MIKKTIVSCAIFSCLLHSLNGSNLMTNKIERTLTLIKPDAVRRKLSGKIIERFENKGFDLVAMKLIKTTKQMAFDHYIEHQNQSFFGEITDYIASGPVIAMIWEGPNAIKATRNMIGNHDPTISAPGTIRGDFTCINDNIVHGARSISEAKREIGIWFKE